MELLRARLDAQALGNHPQPLPFEICTPHHLVGRPVRHLPETEHDVGVSRARYVAITAEICASPMRKRVASLARKPEGSAWAWMLKSLTQAKSCAACADAANSNTMDSAKKIVRFHEVLLRSIFCKPRTLFAYGLSMKNKPGNIKLSHCEPFGGLRVNSVNLRYRISVSSLATPQNIHPHPDPLLKKDWIIHPHLNPLPSRERKIKEIVFPKRGRLWKELAGGSSRKWTFFVQSEASATQSR